jgi:hypothetical protein
VRTAACYWLIFTDMMCKQHLTRQSHLTHYNGGSTLTWPPQISGAGNGSSSDYNAINNMHGTSYTSSNHSDVIMDDIAAR